MTGEKPTYHKRSLAEAKIINALFYLGMGSGVFISPAYRQEHEAVKDFIKEEEIKDIRPPEPPRRPNAKIGKIALSLT